MGRRDFQAHCLLPSETVMRGWWSYLSSVSLFSQRRLCWCRCPSVYGVCDVCLERQSLMPLHHGSPWGQRLNTGEALSPPWEVTACEWSSVLAPHLPLEGLLVWTLPFRGAANHSTDSCTCQGPQSCLAQICAQGCPEQLTTEAAFLRLALLRLRGHDSLCLLCLGTKTAVSEGCKFCGLWHYHRQNER